MGELNPQQNEVMSAINDLVKEKVVPTISVIMERTVMGELAACKALKALTAKNHILITSVVNKPLYGVYVFLPMWDNVNEIVNGLKKNTGE